MRVKYFKRSPCSITWCPVPTPAEESRQLTMPNGSLLSHHSLLALGSRKSYDDSFESHCELEIVDTCAATKKTALGKVICTTSSFTSLDWGLQSKHIDTFPLGLIAGGMDDGSVTIWNPASVVKGESRKSLVHQTKVHTNSVSAVAWNPKENKYLASVGYDGKLFVWDFKNMKKPTTSNPPTGASEPKSSALSDVAWNPNVPYILAAANNLGETQIYDLRAQKIALNIRARTMTPVSSVAWNPGYAREVCICYANNTAEIWDLKQPMSPKMFLEGEHKRNICDLSWSTHDPRLIFTTGEDHRGLLWNSGTGQPLATALDFDTVSFEAQWSPLRPGTLACSGTDGLVSIYDVNYVGEGLTPAWMRRRAAVDFGFGGVFAHVGHELVEVSKRSADGKVKKAKKVVSPRLHVSHLPQQRDVVERAQEFEAMLESFGDDQSMDEFTTEKVKTSKLSKNEDELKTWKLLRLFQTSDASECKQKLLAVLGFNDAESELKRPVIAEEMSTDASAVASERRSEITAKKAMRADEKSEFMDDEIITDETSDGTDDFDNMLQHSSALLSPGAEARHKETTERKAMPSVTSPALFPAESSDDEGFFAELSSMTPADLSKSASRTAASEKGSQEVSGVVAAVLEDAATDEVREDSKVSGMEESGFDKATDVDVAIRKSLIRSDYRAAADLALRNGKMADALMFARCGGDALWDTVAKAYFSGHKQKFISRVFQHIVYSSFDQFVDESETSSWQQTLAIVLQFVTGESECNELCNALAMRLSAVRNRYGATACLMCSNNVEALIKLWTADDLSETGAMDDSRSATQRRQQQPDLVLRNAIEKALVFVNSHWSKQKKLDSGSGDGSVENDDSKALSKVLTEYASLLANEGSLKVAADFLTFLTDPTRCPAQNIETDTLCKLLSRISEADPGLGIRLPAYGRRSQRPHAPVAEHRPAVEPQPAGGRGRGGRPLGRGQRPPAPVQPKPVAVTQKLPVAGRGRGRIKTPVQSPSSSSSSSRPIASTAAGRPPIGGKPKKPIRAGRQRPPAISSGPSPASMSGVTAVRRGRGTPSPAMAPVSAGRGAVGGGRGTTGGRPGGPRPVAAGRSGAPMRRQPPATDPRHRRRVSAPSEVMPQPSAAHRSPVQRPHPHSGTGAMSEGFAVDGGVQPDTGGGRLPPSGGRMPAGRGPHASGGRVPGGRRLASSTAAPTQPERQQMPAVAATATGGRAPGRSVPVGGRRMPRGGGRGGRRPQSGGRPVGHALVDARSGSMPVAGGSAAVGASAVGAPATAEPRRMPARARGRKRGAATGGRGAHSGRRPAAAMPRGHAATRSPPSAPIPVPPLTTSSEVFAGAHRSTSSPVPSFANTTQGTGFYGETTLDKGDPRDGEPLPSDAMDVVNEILAFMDRFDSLQLTATEQRTMSGVPTKLAELRSAVENGRLPYSVYSAVCEMNGLLQSRQYEQALKCVKTLVSDTNIFRTHRRWLTGFRTLILLAKKHLL